MSFNYALLRQSIKDINQVLLKRDTTVIKLCQNSLKLIEETKNLNSFITVCQDESLERAKQLDELLYKEDSGRLLSENKLFAVPISIKDNFCTKNLLTTCGSKMLHNYIPPYTATAVRRLLEANCLLMGKTNMDEFAMGSSSTTSYYGPTANYFKHQLLQDVPSKSKPNEWYMAGGSSTGSAISVASGACFASLGTDTGGSTRQPASLTNVVGFKPTYGLISRFGLVPLAHCLDVVSILARQVDDVHLIFNQIVGLDENDLTTVDHMTELKRGRFAQASSASNHKKTIRIGVPDDFIERGEISSDVAKQYDKTLEMLRKTSNNDIDFEVIKLALPNSSLATECYTIICSAEIASNMSCYDGLKFGLSINPNEMEEEEFNRELFFKMNRDQGFGAEVKKRILLGNYFLLAQNREKYLGQALRLRRMINDEFARAFEELKVDVILMPSTPSTSVTYEEWMQKQDNNKLFHEDYFLIPSNLANLPSISVPAGYSSKGLPIGLQLVSNKFHDLDLLAIARLFEEKIFREKIKLTG